MAKVALVLVLSLMLVLSIPSALGEGLQMRSTVLPGGAPTPSTTIMSPSSQPPAAKGGWTSWFKNKFTMKFSLFGTGNGAAAANGPNGAPAPAPNAAA